MTRTLPEIRTVRHIFRIRGIVAIARSCFSHRRLIAAMIPDIAPPQLRPENRLEAVRPSPDHARKPAPFGASCILCGTDFSPSAAQAIDAAAALAIRQRETLLIVHSMAETFREQLPTNIRDALIPTIEDRLHAEGERARRLGASVEVAVLPGWPDEGINERAFRCQARLIVFGYPELGALNRWLRGSVAEVIAESSGVPTLVVHSSTPFEKWIREDRPLRIVVATDSTKTSESALRWVAEWSTIQPCEITVGYIDHSGKPPAGLETEDAADMTLGASDSELFERTRQFLGDGPTIRVVPGSAHVDDDLIQLAGETHADLLVVGTHQRHGFERAWHRSVSRGILRHAPISVACVPPVPASTNAAEAIH
jgi:nucleotide-binding universal stress UspA family protein